QGTVPVTKRIYFNIDGITPGDGVYELYLYGNTGAGNNNASVAILSGWTAGNTHITGPLASHQSRLVCGNVQYVLYADPGDDNVLPAASLTRFIIPNDGGSSFLTGDFSSMIASDLNAT